jgi:para-aminobenzoate synthetase/4-amino-4-deoxychorismate lyase
MGSVTVEELFSVEKYRTLFQMTSTVTGTLRPALGYYDIFKSMFPSGSITGAPKMRTMEIIRELEATPRGIYTGAIGFIAPNRSATFNVAIRTLVLQDGRARMGVGGGIVADSSPAEEYRECLLKTSFLHLRPLDFQLFETMLWDQSFAFLSMHLDRMESSASYFEFPLDRPAIAGELLERAKQFPVGARYRVKLLLDSAGLTAIHTSAFEPEPPTGHVLLCPERTSSKEVFLRHKTTRRDRYDLLYAEARAAGMDEVIFMNEKEEVTEGAISNVFIRREGRLITPPLSSGVLPGVFRRHLLATEPTAEEGVLRLHDLQSADEVLLCNSVRGIRQVKSLWLETSRHNDLLAP